MKTRWWAVAAVAAFVGFTSIEAGAQYEYAAGIAVRDASDFYEPLAPFGDWVQVSAYGWCWRPAYVGYGWRPYANGHWFWSDSGWYWVSEEPWAWACYHYGRWLWDSYYGWVWMPGTEWAPAWVSWREGGGYIGWAPLPPEADFDPYDDVIYAERAPAPQFVFVECHHFCEPIRPSILVINQTLVQNTINITNIRHVNQIVVNKGPNVAEVQQFTKHQVPVLKVHPPQDRPQIVRGNDPPRVADNATRRDFNGARRSDFRPMPPEQTRKPRDDQRQAPPPPRSLPPPQVVKAVAQNNTPPSAQFGPSQGDGHGRKVGHRRFQGQDND